MDTNPNQNHKQNTDSSKFRLAAVGLLSHQVLPGQCSSLSPVFRFLKSIL